MSHTPLAHARAHANWFECWVGLRCRQVTPTEPSAVLVLVTRGRDRELSGWEATGRGPDEAATDRSADGRANRRPLDRRPLLGEDSTPLFLGRLAGLAQRNRDGLLLWPS